MRTDVYQHVTGRILDALDGGTVPWRNPILGSRDSAWPRNLTSNRTYRGINTFLLALTAWSEGYQSPYWLTFKQAQARGGRVRKGQKSTLVVFWKQLTVEDKEVGKDKLVPLLRHYRVFNTEQCDGVVAPTHDEDEQDRVFQPIAEAASIVEGFDGPSIQHGGHRACYRPKTDEVQLPEPGRFESGEAYYATLFHELTHSTGHSSRLDRGLDTKLAPFGSPDYSREELVAEMGAAFLCGHAGIEPAVLDNAAAYIQGWLDRLKDDKRLVVQAAGAAQKSADLILGVQPAIPETATSTSAS
jgi:antirestriction protein ArdC